MSLIPLPPYSPELNPVEGCGITCAHHWSNREYEGYEGLKTEAIRSLLAVSDAKTLKSICNTDYVQQRA